MIRIVGNKFQLKLTTFDFVPNLPEKGISGLKRRNWSSSLNSAYSNWSMCQVLVQIVNLNIKLLSKKKRGELHQWLLHIQFTAAGTKLRYKRTTLNSRTNIFKKWHFWSETESEHHHWILQIQISLGTIF